jgi:hypothetical protein
MTHEFPMQGLLTTGNLGCSALSRSEPMQRELLGADLRNQCGFHTPENNFRSKQMHKLSHHVWDRYGGIFLSQASSNSPKRADLDGIRSRFGQ